MKKINALKRMVVKAAPLVLVALLCAGCSGMFQERVAMQTSSVGASISKIFEKRTTIDTLSKPAQVFITSAEYMDKIIVTWTKVEGARSYCLERAVSTEKDANGAWKVPDEGDYAPMTHSSFIEGTSFTDTIIDNTPANTLSYTNEAYQKAFFYRICAENKIENYESSEFVYTSSGTLLAPPTNIKATGGKHSDQIDIDWIKAPGSISSYRIYRSGNADGSAGKLIATVYGNLQHYEHKVSVDEQGLNYYFSLVSVAASGAESVSSSVAMGYARKPGAPGMVEGVVVDIGRGQTLGSTGISLSWNKVEVDGREVKYNVFKYSSMDSTQKVVASGITETSCVDTKGLKPNTFYYYQVQAFCEGSTPADTLTGPMSDSGSEAEKPAEGYLLGAPQTVMVRTIDGDTSSNKIAFSAALGSKDCEDNSEVTKKKGDFNTYSYVVYASDAATGNFTEIKTIDAPTPDADNPGYYIETVPSFKFYKMATKNGTVLSDLTAMIAPAPHKAKNLSVTKNKPIPGYTDDIDATSKFPSEPKANANGVHAVKLTWEAPEGGADGGYNIYRSTKEKSGFKKINESPITETSYIYMDPQAKAGNFYYYRVLSLNSLGQGGEYSNTDYGYGALTIYQYLREYIKTTLSSQKKLTLMHKSSDTDKLGQETAYGAIRGSLSYDARLNGASGRVVMEYIDYADFFIAGMPEENEEKNIYFLLDGNTNTRASADKNGTMDGTVTVRGMYPGSVVYDRIQIKGGAAGGGTYGVTRTGIDTAAVQADWTWGEK